MRLKNRKPILYSMLFGFGFLAVCSIPITIITLGSGLPLLSLVLLLTGFGALATAGSVSIFRESSKNDRHKYTEINELSTITNNLRINKMALNKKDSKERKKLMKEAHEIYQFKNKQGFFQTYFDLHYEKVMEKIRDLDAKSLRDSLSKTNPYYKCSK